MGKIIFSELSDSDAVNAVVEQIVSDGNKTKTACFLGHHPSMNLVDAVKQLIKSGYCRIMVVTNAMEIGCKCGQNCACETLKGILPIGKTSLFNEVQHSDLTKILPKLEQEEVVWIMDPKHSQKDELVQKISA